MTGFAWHKITIGSENETVIAVRLRNTYVNNGSDIGEAVGITAIEDGALLEATTEVDDLIKNCQAVRMKIRYRVGDARPKIGSIICDVDKAKTARAQLIGKSYRGGTISSAWFPRQMNLG